MNIVLECLRESGFRLTHPVVTKPLVVNCVPGAGKSSLIESILNRSVKVVAFTFGSAPTVSLSGVRILPISDYTLDLVADKVVIIDEYQSGDFWNFEPDVIFGDPQQAPINCSFPRANYCCSVTKRFGKATCALLNNLGFSIESDKEDIVEVLGLYEADLVGQVICFEKSVKGLLSQHSVDYLDECQYKGRTFKEVTVCFEESEIPKELRHSYYLALTRHSDHLRILTLDATLTSS